jgi:hypothetical protein
LSIFHSNIRSLRKKLCDIIYVIEDFSDIIDVIEEFSDNFDVIEYICYIIDVRDRPFNLLGRGGLCFFFGQHQS